MATKVEYGKEEKEKKNINEMAHVSEFKKTHELDSIVTVIIKYKTVFVCAQPKIVLQKCMCLMQFQQFSFVHLTCETNKRTSVRLFWLWHMHNMSASILAKLIFDTFLILLASNVSHVVCMCVCELPEYKPMNAINFHSKI